MNGDRNALQSLYFEDFAAGDRYTSDGITVSESQIVDYALTYDPQPFHIDLEAARAHPFGTIFASGLHTLALSFRLFAMTRVLADCSHAGAGMDHLRWRKPVMPGDTLHLELEVLRARTSTSNPRLGVLVLRHDTINQRDELVLTLECTHIIKRRPDDLDAPPAP